MDPLYGDKIITFFDKINLSSYVKNINTKDIFKKFIISDEIEILYYNYVIIKSILIMINNIDTTTIWSINDYKYISLKRYEREFTNLLLELLINNWQNIRYDFTIYIIHLECYMPVIRYLEKHGLIYLLSRINPKKLHDDGYVAKYIYNQKLTLQMAWMGAIAKASKGNI